jgi:hypothetical protein
VLHWLVCTRRNSIMDGLRFLVGMLSRASVILLTGIVVGYCPQVQANNGQKPSVTVRNPAIPTEGRITLATRELWRVGAAEGDPVFGVIVRVLSDDQGHLYALDRQLSTIFVFSAGGDFLGAIAREGEGPGEVRGPEDMAFLPDSTLGISTPHSGRIIRLSRDGIPQPSIGVGGPEVSGGERDWLEGIGWRAGSMVLLCQRVSHSPGQQNTLHYLAGFDLNGFETSRYFEKTVVDDFAKLRLSDVRSYYPRGRLWTIGPDGRVYLVPERNHYRIQVHAANGTLERIIERDFRPVPRDPREMAATRRGYEEWYRSFSFTIEMDDNEPAITAMMIDAEGYLWVLTSRGVHEQDDGIMATYDVFDREGRFVREVAVACLGDGRLDDLFFLKGNQLLLITRAYEARMALRGTPVFLDDVEAAPMELVCLEILP